MKVIRNGKIIHDKKVLKNHYLLFDKKILSISQKPPSQTCEVIDAKGNYVSAGFVDLHLHGSGGADVMDGTRGALETISQSLLQTGTTSFVATTMTMSQEEITKALDAIVTHSQSVGGAKILGIHLEGPFINPQKCGAQNPQYIQEPNLDWMEPYLSSVRIITIAPEIEGARDFIRQVTDRYPHIILSIGHSEADYDVARQSFDWGISHATHLFNAMPPWHHREPGLIGAVFECGVTADIIADLIHTHPAILSAVERIKRDRLILITDAMRAGCMKSGEYELGGLRVNVEKGRATLANGVLAGSVLKLNEAVRNYYTHTDATIAEAVWAATSLPGRRLGLPVGELIPGNSADIVLFDEAIEIRHVYLDGDLKYNNPNQTRSDHASQ